MVRGISVRGLLFLLEFFVLFCFVCSVNFGELY